MNDFAHLVLPSPFPDVSDKSSLLKYPIEVEDVTSPPFQRMESVTEEFQAPGKAGP